MSPGINPSETSARMRVLDDKEEGSIYSYCNLYVSLIAERSAYPIMDGKKVIAKILKIESIDFVTCFPYNPIIDAIAAEGIRPVMPRTERVAVGIADGFTRASFGRCNGVCLVQGGPGNENQFAGVAQAFADSVPILLLPCGPDRRELRRPQFVALNNYRSVTKSVDMAYFKVCVFKKYRRLLDNFFFRPLIHHLISLLLSFSNDIIKIK